MQVNVEVGRRAEALDQRGWAITTKARASSSGSSSSTDASLLMDGSLLFRVLKAPGRPLQAPASVEPDSSLQTNWCGRINGACAWPPR